MVRFTIVPPFRPPANLRRGRCIRYRPKTGRRHSFQLFLSFDIERAGTMRARMGVAISKKSRPIGVAGHADGYKFARHVKILGERCEDQMKRQGVSLSAPKK
jgi:hypothetical protein